uniref:Uncharacterized protein n=1 Tax=Magnetococcus massalia (strain MO-1) TaxID=451514 RepID=A0A1S7LMG8_MAGMO|nr:Protein of unknown function [Candidatus Magnetococcus massalia]
MSHTDHHAKPSLLYRLRSYLSKRLDPGALPLIHAAEAEKLAEVVQVLEQRLDSGEPFLPRIIHLETRSRCNGHCSFCLASVDNDPRDDELMPQALVDKVLHELSALAYPYRLSMYSNNEPLMDKRIYDFVTQARSQLPKAYLEIKTNGTSLTMEKIYKLFDNGLDILYVNDYRPSADVEAGEHRANVAKIKQELKGIRRFKGHYGGGRYSDRIIITLRKQDDALYNRAGTAPNAVQIRQPLHAPCLRPFEMMTINAKGEVGLCSDDVLFSTHMGNVNNNSLMEIWRSAEYNTIRRSLLKGDRSCKSACNACDNKGHTWEIFKELGV